MNQKIKQLKILEKDGKYFVVKMVTNELINQGLYIKSYFGLDTFQLQKVIVTSIDHKILQKVPQYKKIYQKEIDTLSKLSKGMSTVQKLNLVSVYENYIQSNNNFYIITQYCDSGDLSKTIHYKKNINKWFSFGEFIRIFVDIINGYEVLKYNNYIHSNIRPQKIFFNGKCTKIGFSFFHQKQEPGFQNKQFYYNAIQKLQNKHQNKHQDHRSDIYSIGVILYELFFDHHPYFEDQELNKFRNTKELLECLKTKTIKKYDPKISKPSMVDEKIYDGIIQLIILMVNDDVNDRITFENIRVKINDLRMTEFMSESLDLQLNNLPNQIWQVFQDTSDCVSGKYQGSKIIQQPFNFDIASENYEKICKRLETQIYRSHILGDILKVIQQIFGNMNNQWMLKMQVIPTYLLHYNYTSIKQTLIIVQKCISQLDDKQIKRIYYSQEYKMISVLRNNLNYLITTINNGLDYSCDLISIAYSILNNIQYNLHNLQSIDQNNKQLVVALDIAKQLISDLTKGQQLLQRTKQLMAHHVTIQDASDILLKQGIQFMIQLKDNQ